MTLQEFFSFPTPINDAESRLHNSVTWILVCASMLLDYFVGFPYLYFYVLYGFTVRVLTGPRLCPNAFFILYILRPAMVKLGILKNLFLPSPPKRYTMLHFHYNMPASEWGIRFAYMCIFVVMCVYRFAQLVGWCFTFTGIVLRYTLPDHLFWVSFIGTSCTSNTHTHHCSLPLVLCLI